MRKMEYFLVKGANGSLEYFFTRFPIILRVVNGPVILPNFTIITRMSYTYFRDIFRKRLSLFHLALILTFRGNIDRFVFGFTDFRLQTMSRGRIKRIYIKIIFL